MFLRNIINKMLAFVKPQVIDSTFIASVDTS